MFRDGEWSWYSIPEGKHQPLEFTEYVSRNFNFRSTVSPFHMHIRHLSTTPYFFFYLSLASSDLFPHGCRSWTVLAAVHKALEGKCNQIEKYT